jgi:hypothetical protein
VILLQGRGRLHLLRVHSTVLGAQRWSGRFEPFTRRMNSVAAIATGALDGPGGRLFAPVGMAAGAKGQPKSAVWQRPCSFQYWPHGLLEFRPGRCRLHLPDETYTPGDSPEGLAVASRNANRGVCELMAKDRRHLHRQQVLRFAEVGPDEDLKMPILTALIIPALAYAPAAPAA